MGLQGAADLSIQVAEDVDGVIGVQARQGDQPRRRPPHAHRGRAEEGHGPLGRRSHHPGGVHGEHQGAEQLRPADASPPLGKGQGRGQDRCHGMHGAALVDAVVFQAVHQVGVDQGRAGRREPHLRAPHPGFGPLPPGAGDRGQPAAPVLPAARDGDPEGVQQKGAGRGPGGLGNVFQPGAGDMAGQAPQGILG